MPISQFVGLQTPQCAVPRRVAGGAASAAAGALMGCGMVHSSPPCTGVYRHLRGGISNAGADRSTRKWRALAALPARPARRAAVVEPRPRVGRRIRSLLALISPLRLEHLSLHLHAPAARESASWGCRCSALRPCPRWQLWQQQGTRCCSKPSLGDAPGLPWSLRGPPPSPPALQPYRALERLRGPCTSRPVPSPRWQRLWSRGRASRRRHLRRAWCAPPPLRLRRPEHVAMLEGAYPVPFANPAS